jgi:PST family polysaccharide transporter
MYMLLTRVGLKVLGLGVLAIQARLLFPEDFAILSIAMGAIAISDVLTNLQVGAALVRIPALSKEHLDSAFTLAVLRAIFTCALLVLASPFIASAMHEPRLEAVVLVLAVLPLVDGLRSPGLVNFERAIDFSRENYIRIFQSILSWCLLIALALHMGNYWALVWATVGSRIGATALSYFLAPMTPGLSLRHWRELIGFSGWQLGTGILWAFNQRFESFILGRMLGMPVLGNYEMGSNLSATATDEIANTLSRALYPGFAHVAGDKERLAASYVEAQAITFGIVAPLGAGLALVAAEFVRVVAGDRWLAAIPVVRVLAPLLALAALFSNFQPLMMALNKTRRMFLAPAIAIPVRLPLLAFGCLTYGLTGFLMARVADGLFYMALVTHLASRELPIRLQDYVEAAWRSCAAVATMIVGLLILNAVQMQLGYGGSPLAWLLVKTFVGGVIYLPMHYGLWCRCGRPKVGIEHRVAELLQKIRAGIWRRGMA